MFRTRLRPVALTLVAAALVAGCASTQRGPTEWDGLVRQPGLHRRRIHAGRLGEGAGLGEADRLAARKRHHVFAPLDLARPGEHHEPDAGIRTGDVAHHSARTRALKL